jgi:AbrB family looped-hinge helix DNA binding protein
MDRQFYGSTVMGERGQLVIPAEARKELGIEKGEKLLVFGFHKNALMITKLSSFKELTKEMSKKQKEIEDILQNA